MTPKQITHEYLSNMELRIKAELTKEETDRRHEDRRKAQEIYLIVDDVKIDNALLKQSQTNMSKTLEKIEEWQKELNIKFDIFINKANDTFATKKDQEEDEKKISELEKWINGINTKIAIATWCFTGVVFIIEKLWK